MVVLFGLTHCGLMAHWVQNSERQDLMRLMGTMRSDAHPRPHTPPALRTFDYLVHPRLHRRSRSTLYSAVI
ncbi:hypothetical protein VTO73DRAFT_2333 [Trametes versicolor]